MKNTQNNKTKASNKVNLMGIVVTLLAGLLTGLLTGLIIFGINTVLRFSIPLILPMLAGVIVGIVVIQVGTKKGRVRSKKLSIAIGIICALLAWATTHFASYVQFNILIRNDILQHYPQATSEEIRFVTDEWMKEIAGVSGFLGFMLLKAEGSELEIMPVLSGVAVPPFRLSGILLFAYWLLELACMLGTVILGIRKTYFEYRFCDKCNSTIITKTAITGTDEYLGDVISDLQQGDILSATKYMAKGDVGNIIKLNIEYCSECGENNLLKLILIEDTGPQTWIEKISWQGELTSEEVQQLVNIE